MNLLVLELPKLTPHHVSLVFLISKRARFRRRRHIPRNPDPDPDAHTAFYFSIRNLNLGFHSRSLPWLRNSFLAIYINEDKWYTVCILGGVMASLSSDVDSSSSVADPPDQRVPLRIKFFLAPGQQVRHLRIGFFYRSLLGVTNLQSASP